MAVSPEERDSFLSFAAMHQRAGDVFGWSLDEGDASVTLFVPADRETPNLPEHVAGIHITIVVLPTPKEQDVVRR